MNRQYQSILAEAGIRPSIQRIAVYSWLCEHPIHPDVETVYDALNPIYPTLSKTTVYNTLKLFEEKKIVQSIKIEDDKLRFDAEMKDHLHFKCIKCNGIFDVFAGTEVSQLFNNISTMVPKGFSISKIQTNLWGICQNCADNA
ncbi:MAG: transcriptional repressor [Treponema sp.]|nr:transcriptional repressor [Treponema sp.]